VQGPDETAAPAAAPPRPTRRWVKGCGIALILAVWSPLLVFLGGLGLAWLSAYRVESAAVEARAAVRVGATLGEAILSSSAGVGTGPLECYETACLEPRPEMLLASRRSHWFGLQGPGGSLASLRTLEEWRGQLGRLDGAGCRRVKVTFCGRPWVTFHLEMDGAQRVGSVGPLNVTSD
jgi:hypothetical protein